MIAAVKHLVDKIPITARQFIKFCMVGVANTAIDLAAYFLFTRVFGVYFLIANILAFAISATNSYILNRRFTFKSANPKKHLEFTAFIVILLIGLGIAESILYLVVQLGFSDIIGKLASVAVVMFWNFFGSKFLVFEFKKAWQIWKR